MAGDSGTLPNPGVGRHALVQDLSDLASAVRAHCEWNSVEKDTDWLPL